MELNDFLLTCAALLPALILCIYVYRKDRVEKEPLVLLLSLLALGAISCYPAAELETLMGKWLVKLFEPYGSMKDGVLQLSSGYYKLYQVCNNFGRIALVEELCKWTVLMVVTARNKNFNCVFDGLIYAIFVSLGFAALENVMYVLKYGWATAVTRAILSVPGHMFFGVLMGYYYSFWRICNVARKQERQLKAAGLISAKAREFSGAGQLIASILLPILAHGLYDFCCYMDNWVADLVLAGLMTFLYMHCFGKIAKLSKLDMTNRRYSRALLLKKYPHLSEHL